jgi:PAS domain S-box-containing protein
VRKLKSAEDRAVRESGTSEGYSSIGEDHILKTILSATPGNIALLDREGRCLYVTPSAPTPLGLKPEDMIGKTGRDLGFSPEVMEAFNRLREEALATGESLRSEVCSPRTGKCFEYCIAPVKGASGRFEGTVVTAVDLTDRKKAEEELRQRAEQFLTIANYTYDWESWFSLDGKLLWVNPAVERQTGYTVEECLSMPDYPSPMICEEDKEKILPLLRDPIEGSSANDIEFRIRRKDEGMAWGALSFQSIYDSAGSFAGLRTSIRDINRRKRAEEELQ